VFSRAPFPPSLPFSLLPSLPPSLPPLLAFLPACPPPAPRPFLTGQEGDLHIDLHMWSTHSRELAGGTFSAGMYDTREGGRKGRRGRKGGRKALKNIRDFFQKRPKVVEEGSETEGGREGGEGHTWSAMIVQQEDEEKEEEEEEEMEEEEDDDDDEEEEDEDEEEEEEEEESMHPGITVSKPTRLPALAALKWVIRASVRCVRTGRWALLWESAEDTTFYTEEPDENWRASLPQGSLSECGRRGAGRKGRRGGTGGQALSEAISSSSPAGTLINRSNSLCTRSPPSFPPFRLPILPQVSSQAGIQSTRLMPPSSMSRRG